jgi:hypothetical protein
MDTEFTPFISFFMGITGKYSLPRFFCCNYCDHHGDQLCSHSVHFAYDCISFFPFITLFGCYNSHGRICF